MLILAEIVWILIIHRADFRKPVDHLDLGSAESILLAVPAALTLLLMLAAGAAVNEEHESALRCAPAPCPCGVLQAARVRCASRRARGVLNAGACRRL